MRVTNSMMRNNSMMNMQKNKNVYNKYLTQYNTEKKIQRPSDSPTIAVRALKYRTTLTEIEQYLKNIEDATSWMNQTELGLKDVDKILSTMQEYFTQAANGTQEASDREKIVAQLNEYSKYIYEQDANADYNGRYLYTGFRTDVSLLYDKDDSDTIYSIKENLDIDNISKYQYVYGGAVFDESKTANDYAQEASEFKVTHRIMISYQDCMDTKPVISYVPKGGTAPVAVDPAKIQVKNIGSNTKVNEHLSPGEDEIFFVPETGELVFGDKIYEDVRAGSDLSIQYEKSEFKKNDIRPEHYFECTATNTVTNKTQTYRNPGGQDMNFQINFSQSLTVNTMGCNAFDTSIRRKIDDVINVCNDIDVIEKNLSSVKKRISDCDENDEETLARLNELKNQIETQLSLQKTVLTNTLSSGITTCQNAQSKLNVALASHGARYNRMQMTQQKLKDQQLDTEELKSQNEDADLGEAYINFSEADLLYQATLSATNKILGESLLNFI